MLLKSLPHYSSKRLYQFIPPSRMFENKSFPSSLLTLNITNLLKDLYQFDEEKKKQNKTWQCSEPVCEPDWLGSSSNYLTTICVLWASSFSFPHPLFLSLQWGTHPPCKAWCKASIIFTGQTHRLVGQDKHSTMLGVLIIIRINIIKAQMLGILIFIISILLTLVGLYIFAYIYIYAKSYENYFLM